MGPKKVAILCATWTRQSAILCTRDLSITSDPRDRSLLAGVRLAVAKPPARFRLACHAVLQGLSLIDCPLWRLVELNYLALLRRTMTFWCPAEPVWDTFVTSQPTCLI